MSVLLESVFPLTSFRVFEEFGRIASVLSGDERARLVNRIALEIIANDSHSSFERLMPFLAPDSEQAIDTSRLSVRAENVLKKASINVWRDILPLCPKDLLRLRSLGRKTEQEFLRSFAERSLLVASRPEIYLEAGSDPPRDEGADRKRPCSTFVFRLSTVANWAVLERGLQNLGDLLTGSLSLEDMPGDVREMLEKLRRTPLIELSDSSLSAARLEDLLTELLSDPRPRHRAILQRRIIDDPPAPLLDLGRQFGITRERARQIQVLAQSRMDNLMKGDRFAQLRWRAEHLSQQLGVTAPANSEIISPLLDDFLRDLRDEPRTRFRPLMLHLAGPYRVRNGWLVRNDAVAPAPAELARKADKFGVLTLPVAREWLARRGVTERFQPAWLEKSGFRIVDNSVLCWSGSVADRCVAFLTVRGKPTSINVLQQAIKSCGAKRIRDLLLMDRRLSRVSRDRWVLRKWGLEEYRRYG